MSRDHHQSSFNTKNILLEQDPSDFVQAVKKLKLYKKNPKKAKSKKPSARSSQLAANSQKQVANSYQPLIRRWRPPKALKHWYTETLKHSDINDLVYAIVWLGCVSAVVLLASSILARSFSQSLTNKK